MKATVLAFTNLHEHGGLFVAYLRARKQMFIDGNRWELAEAEGMEYDQYDNPLSRWIAVHEGEKVLAGLRLTPTTARCGMYSYMIRDAQLGLLPGIPSTLLDFDAPVDEHVWESSRIFVADDVPGAIRAKVHRRLMTKLVSVSLELGAHRVIGLVPAVWHRWVGALGMAAYPAGPVLNMDGIRYQVAEMYVARDGVKRPWLRDKVDKNQKQTGRRFDAAAE